MAMMWQKFSARNLMRYHRFGCKSCGKAIIYIHWAVSMTLMLVGFVMFAKLEKVAKNVRDFSNNQFDVMPIVFIYAKGVLIQTIFYSLSAIYIRKFQ